jgi:bifunctional non-homologous end joining protein LigD
MLPSVEPILPILSKVIPVGREWLYEPKLDGFRGTLFLEGNRGFFRSKTKKKMPRFKDLAESLARTAGVEDAIFDGEIIVMRESRVDFNALFWADGEPAYAAFDLLWLNGVDLRPLPLHKRKRKLRALTKRGPIAYVEAMREPQLYDAVVHMDLEGIVAKRKNDPYAPATEWLKIKHVGYTQKEGRAQLFHRLRHR